MPKRKRLTDLYKRGQTITIVGPDDENVNDGVKVWIQKPNPTEMESIHRRANARKALIVREGQDEASEIFLAAWAESRDFLNKETLITLALYEDLSSARMRANAEIADEEEWKDEDYLQGLLDLWQGDPEQGDFGLAEVWTSMPEEWDETDFSSEEVVRMKEAKRVFSELQRFDAQVEQVLKAEEERLRVDWSSRDDEFVVRAAVKELVRQQANQAFVDEYDRQLMYYTVREPDDHKKRYFANMAEIDDLEEGVKDQLKLAMNSLLVDVVEGKDSPVTPTSSDSSESVEEEEISPDSGLQAAPA